MWGKSSKPVPEQTSPATAVPAETPRAETPAPRAHATGTRIGPGVSIRGEIRGNEDVVIEGEVQGNVNLGNANVTVGQQGRVQADMEAREITVQGRVEGTLTAKERVRISATGVVHGVLLTQRIAIEDGAILQGSVDILRPGESRPSPQPVVRAHAAAAGAIADANPPEARPEAQITEIAAEESLEASAEMTP